MKAISKLKDEARRYEQKEEWDKAIDAYLQVIRAGDDGAGDVELPLFNRIGDLLVRLGRPLEAVSYYAQAADRYAEIGLFNNAIALCNKALRYQPDHVELMRKLGHFSASQGFLTDARRYFLEYAEHKFAAGDTDAAFAALEDFAGVADDGDVRELLGRRLQMHGRTAEAREALRRALALHQAAGDADRAAAVTALIRALEPEVDVSGAAPPAPAPDILDEILDDVDDADEWQPAAQETAAFGEETAAAPDEQVFAEEDEVTPDAELAGLELGHAAWESPVALPGLELPGLEPSGHTPWDEVDGTEVEGLETTTFDLGGLTVDYGDAGAGLDIERTETSWDDDPRPFDYEVIDDEASDAAGSEAAPEAATPRDEAPAAGGMADDPPAGEPTPEPHEAYGGDLPFAGGESPDEDLSFSDLDVDLPLLEGTEGDLPLLSIERVAGDPAFGDSGIEAEGDLPFLDEGGTTHVDLPFLDDADSQETDRPFAESDYLPIDEPFLEGGLQAEPLDPLRDPDLSLPDAEFAFRDTEPAVPDAGFPASDADLEVPDWTAAPLPDPGEASPAELPGAAGADPAAWDLELPGQHWDVPAPDAGEEQDPPGQDLTGTPTAEVWPVADAAPMPRTDAAASLAEGEPERQPARESSREPAGEVDAEYVDLAALLDDHGERTTRFRVTESAPTGDDEADFAELLSQFKDKVSEHLPTEDAAAHYDLALAFKEMGLLDEAIAEFQVAFRSEQMRLKICEELGECFLQKEQYNIAEKVLQRALALPRSDDLELLGVYYHLGRAYEELGRTDDAKDAYERVLSLDINFQDAAGRLARL
jgi:tetratricopeptide (TPR) repeat protein